MNVEQLKEEKLRLSEEYNRVQEMYDDDALNKVIFHTLKALAYGYLPDGFADELNEYLEILNLVKRNRGIQSKHTR